MTVAFSDMRYAIFSDTNDNAAELLYVYMYIYTSLSLSLSHKFLISLLPPNDRQMTANPRPLAGGYIKLKSLHRTIRIIKRMIKTIFDGREEEKLTARNYNIVL